MSVLHLIPYILFPPAAAASTRICFSQYLLREGYIPRTQIMVDCSVCFTTYNPRLDGKTFYPDIFMFHCDSFPTALGWILGGGWTDEMLRPGKRGKVYRGGRIRSQQGDGQRDNSIVRDLSPKETITTRGVKDGGSEKIGGEGGGGIFLSQSPSQTAR